MTELREYDPMGDALVFANDVYQIIARRSSEEWAVLSIRRHDRQPVTDWRDVQWIKNQIIGPEIEAVQLFPAESRLVDTSNQYWVYANLTDGYRFPFGFDERTVTENVSIQLYGHGKSVQRPFADHVRPSDLEAQEAKLRSIIAEVSQS